MCRLVAYLGAPIPLAALVTEGPHPLYVQSYRAREMRGAVNADGFGAGWYLPGDPRPCTYRNAAPIWADANLDSLGRAITARCAVAVVRNATPGMPYGLTDTPPFADPARLFVHNGSVGDFRTRMLRRLREGLSDATYGSIAGGTDSEHIFALVRERLAVGSSPRAALCDAARTVTAWSRELGVHALLTLVLTDGESLVALRAAEGGAAPTLYALARGARWPGGVLLASERIDDDPAWKMVPEGAVIEVHGDGEVHTTELSA